MLVCKKWTANNIFKYCTRNGIVPNNNKVWIHLIQQNHQLKPQNGRNAHCMYVILTGKAVVHNNKKAFQWDAYRPLWWPPLDVSTWGIGVPRRGRFAIAGCTYSKNTYPKIPIPLRIPTPWIYLPFRYTPRIPTLAYLSPRTRDMGPEIPIP